MREADSDRLHRTELERVGSRSVSEVSRSVTARCAAPSYTWAMKVPPTARQLTRRLLGMGKAPSISPPELAVLARAEPVVIVAVGLVRSGVVDAQLPGEQRVASLGTLARVVADVPRDRPIVLHCG